MKKNLRQLGESVGLEVKVVKYTAGHPKKVIRALYPETRDKVEVEVPLDEPVFASKSARPLLSLVEFLSEDNTESISDTLLPVSQSYAARAPKAVADRLMKMVHMIEQGKGE